jgi:hypothetical protein
MVSNDWRKADLTAGEYAMLEYAEKLTIAPSTMTEDDIEVLRAAGWADRDILDIVHVCAYFNFRVRVVDGLGLRHGEDRYEAARENRRKAAELAAEKGTQLPADIWGITAEASLPDS